MVSAARWKAAREQARRAAQEELLQGSNLWGICVFVLVTAIQHHSCDNNARFEHFFAGTARLW
jgi:hypothetical protein